MSSNKKTVLITGANTGLGLEAVRALIRSGKPYNIIIGSRQVENGKDAIASIQKDFPAIESALFVVKLDISSDSSIESARDLIAQQFDHLDILVNNAGASFDREVQAGNLTLREGWNRTWDVNVSGTMILTNALVPLLLKTSDPRILFVTSGTSAISETDRSDTPPFKAINSSPAAGWPKGDVVNPITIYRSSKAGMNMAMREWHRMLKNDGVKVWAISPGFLATGLGGIGEEQLKKMGALDPSVGGEFIKDVIEGKRDEDVGKAIRANMIQPW